MSHDEPPSHETQVARSAALDHLRHRVRELEVARTSASLLYWDERTHMPEPAASWRSAQRAWLAGVVHELATRPQLGAAISAVEDEGDATGEARVLRRDFERATSLPRAHVEAVAAASSAAYVAWERARVDDDFADLCPHLERLCELGRAEAELRGYVTEPYEAMLQLWEPGIAVAAVERLFQDVQTGSHALLEHVRGERSGLLARGFDAAGKRRFEQQAVVRIGYDWTRGRVDATSRAFCLTAGPDDVRLTTRFHSTDGFSAFHSSLHEAGHGIYAQSFARLGVPLTLADAPGPGMDESQSRLFENLVGRSDAFWDFHFPRLVDTFPGTISQHEQETFMRDIRRSERWHVRVGSEEVSYNLHVLLRFRLERALLNGDLEVKDLPETWSELSLELLGAKPPSDRDGCMQDVHWPLAQWGYFPTYMLGNVYGAQLLAAARCDVPDIDERLRSHGDAPGLRSWLDENVYRHGRRFDSVDLVERATGQPVSADPLLRHLRAVSA